jgi:hypothetical protein
MPAGPIRLSGSQTYDETEQMTLLLESVQEKSDGRIRPVSWLGVRL